MNTGVKLCMTMSTAAPIASGSQPPDPIFARLAEKKPRSMARNNEQSEPARSNDQPRRRSTAKNATATTVPAGLTVNFTYDGSATAPTNAGTYAVVASFAGSTDYAAASSAPLRSFSSRS